MNTVHDELVATELIFENVLTPLEPAEIVSLLSCLIFEERSQDAPEPILTEALASAKEHMEHIADLLGNIQIECGLAVEHGDYVKKLNATLMETVYQWARQTPFQDIMDLTQVLEGSIVRCITRLAETCKEVRNVARIIGDTVLYTKMETAAQLIKRDIVFSTSLYLIK